METSVRRKKLKELHGEISIFLVGVCQVASSVALCAVVITICDKKGLPDAKYALLPLIGPYKYIAKVLVILICRTAIEFVHNDEWGVEVLTFKTLQLSNYGNC